MQKTIALFLGMLVAAQLGAAEQSNVYAINIHPKDVIPSSFQLWVFNTNGIFLKFDYSQTGTNRVSAFYAHSKSNELVRLKIGAVEPEPGVRLLGFGTNAVHLIFEYTPEAVNKVRAFYAAHSNELVQLKLGAFQPDAFVCRWPKWAPRERFYVHTEKEARALIDWVQEK